jgi:glutathione synthase/RimK-type ligase-like ATP-grasp enzyme
MKIALASCLELPGWERDDHPFHDALTSQGVTYTIHPWEDSSVKWEDYDACLIRTTWNYQVNLEKFLAWAEEVSQKTKLLNPYPVIHWNSHKSYLKDLEAKGAPVLPTKWLSQGGKYDVKDLLADWDVERAFLKPAVGATARETLRFHVHDEAGLGQAQAHIERLVPDEDLLLQPYYKSVETFGELSLLFFGGELSHSVRKIPIPGDYRVQDDHGAKDEPYAPEPEFVELGREILSRMDVEPLYARIDFLTADDGSRRVNELELIEPSLFFRHSKRAPGMLVQALLKSVSAAE